MHDPTSTLLIAILTVLASAAAVLAVGRFAGRWPHSSAASAQLALLLVVSAGAAGVFTYRALVLHRDWLPLRAHVDGLMLMATLLGFMLVFLQIGRRLPSAAAFGGPLLVLLLAWAICASAWTYAPFHFGPDRVQRSWSVIHLFGVYAGALFVALGAIAGGMFLYAQHRLRSKAGELAAPLASLETAEKVIVRTSALGFALLTLGLASGLIIIASGPTVLGAGWWYSPKVILAFVVWLIYALLMNVRHATAFRGARAAWLSLLGLLLLLATFAIANAMAKAGPSATTTAPAESAVAP